MAIRFRKGRKAPYQVYWNNPYTGKRESASFLTKEEALREDSLVKHRLRFDRESFKHEEIREEEETRPVFTLEMCVLEYLKEKQFSKPDLARQLSNVKMALQAFGKTPVNEIDHTVLSEFMDKMTATGVRPATVRKRMSILRTVLRWGESKKMCNHVEFPRLPSPQYRSFVPPSTEELEAMLSVASPHMCRVIIIGAQFGARVGECELLQLTWEDVDLSRRVLRIHGSKKNPNASWREVPIRESLLPVIKQWQEEDAAAGMHYLIHWRGKPVANIRCGWLQTLKRAGITRNIRPYDLRHAFGTELVAAGVDVGTVAKLMGHSNPTMLLKHYQYVMDTQKRSAVEALPEITYVPKRMCPNQ